MEKVWELHGLTEEEYRRILSKLSREPNGVELGILGALWSEHCSYKSSRRHLREFPTEAPWVIQGPGENAGVVKIDEEVWVAFKVESHNHPSFIEPFNGAATGVGGIIRDVVSMGARPVALADSLRFGELTQEHTKRLLKGVVKGISSYGNSIGIPTVAGETLFESSYETNPLVNAFCLGILPAGRMLRARATSQGQILFLMGSSTGRDGIHGAVMASGEFGEDTEHKRPNVQVGDPYFGKKLLEAVMEIVEEGLAVGIQDLGAAGLAGSASEVAAKSELGAELYLDKVPLREEGMNPYEILLSESQERMLIIAEEDKLPRLEEIAKRHHLEGAVVGRTTEGGTLRVFFGEEKVAELPVSLIVNEAPVYDRETKEPSYFSQLREFDQDSLPEVDLKEALRKVLSSPNVADKSPVFTQYDYQVGTNTVLKPGGDAAVLRIKWPSKPRINSQKGLAISSEGNGRFVFLNPYEGAKYVVAEVYRNLSCVGAKPLAMTDCLNFGNPERPEIMWQFVQAVKGMAEACSKLNFPVVSGNVSLYNETVDREEVRNVFPTPVVVGVGVLENAEDYVGHAFAEPSEIYLIGDLSRSGRVDGSEYLKVVHGLVKGDVPYVDLEKEKALSQTLLELNAKDLLLSAHDVSVGGLMVALLESLFPSELGAQLEIYTEERLDFSLFAEMPTRVVVSVKPELSDELKDIVEKNSLGWTFLGRVVEGRELSLSYNGEPVLKENIDELKGIWQKGLEGFL